jgi:NAD(P)H dehydrogenase (quinone)
MSLKILVVLAHPGRGSFNHAIAETVSRTLEGAGHLVTFHDLYAEHFQSHLPAEEITQEAVLPPFIEQRCAELSESDGIVVIHPNWWGQPPAILKGWIDRVFRPGVAYRFQENDSGEGVPIGLLRAHTALVFNTSNTPPLRARSLWRPA